MAFSILNHESIVVELMASLKSTRIATISGPPGSGKTAIAESVAANWTGNVVSSGGDEAQKVRRFFPFQYGISQFSTTKRFLSKAASGAAAKGASALPIAGPLAGFLVEKLLSSSKEMNMERYSYLATEEQEILYDFQSISDGGPLLFICDDIQFWDESSKSLLNLMLSGALDKAYTFVKESRFVLIKTMTDDSEANFEDVIKISMRPSPNWEIKYVDRSSFSTVLENFGLRKHIPTSTLDAIYSICGGHLHIAKQLVDYIEAGNDTSFVGWLEDGGSTFLNSLVRARLHSLGEIGKNILDILQKVTTIGQVFSEYEIACLCNYNADETKNILLKCESLNLIKVAEKSACFAHNALQQCLRLPKSFRSKALHRQFAACLQKLRPGDYRSRSLHFAEAEEREEAEVLAVCAMLQDLRHGGDQSEMEPLIKPTGWLAVVSQALMDAYRLSQEKRLDAALDALEIVDPTIHPLIQGEAAYIKSLCLIKGYSYELRQQALDVLKKSINMLSDEGEMFARLLSTQLVALAHQRHMPEAFQCEASLIEHLRKRVRFDPDAVDAMMILDRKSDLLYPADQAHHRLERAKKYFSPSPGQQPRNIYQYCATTINLSANCIMLAEYDEAISHLRELTDFLDENAEYAFNRYEVLTNNVIVSEFRAGHLDATTASIHFESIVQNAPKVGDSYLIRSNLGACLILADRIAESLSTLEELYRDLRAESSIDHYHLYYGGSNYATALHLDGQHDKATTVLEQIAEGVDVANPPHRAFFRLRYQIVKEAISTNRIMSPSAWDALPLAVEPMGPGRGWRHYGRGILLTDLQIWSES